MSQLDDDPRNVLGKNILNPADEARLVAEGAIFVALLPPSGRGCPPDRAVLYRPFSVIGRDILRNDDPTWAVCPQKHNALINQP